MSDFTTMSIKIVRRNQHLIAMRLRWEMIKDMKKGGEIIADGETVYKNGKWLK